MSPFSSRAAADELARLLDGGTVAGPEGALVAGLRSVGADLDAAAAPRPEFRAALRTRLVAVATVQAAAPAVAPAAPARPRGLAAAVSWSTARRGPAVAAGAMASVVAFTGVAVAGSQSLPGDPFYGVKRGTEAVQLAFADGEVEEGTRHLDFAANRLREVRGLTLGRDAVDAGPVLGPSASAAGITLRSVAQPLPSGEALGAPVAERVAQTLADMDEQTRKGTRLLSAAHRSTGAREPLRALNRFATRQSAGLEELLPALPSATRQQARASLALVSAVAEETGEALGIGVCGAACDPDSAAPTVPVTPGAPGTPAPSSSEAPCGCEPAPTPAPAPTSAATPGPSGQPTPAPQPEPTPTPQPTPTPTPTPSPTPQPSPTSGGPVPLPSLPAPIPSLPVPLPTITLPPAPLAPAVPELSSNSVPQPAPAPAPALTPAPVPTVATRP